jgi:hypothetical protein
MKVYVMFHEGDEESPAELLGVYVNRDTAQKALDALIKKYSVIYNQVLTNIEERELNEEEDNQ